MSDARPKILFVDDEPEVLALLLEIFSDDYACVGAPDATEALKHLRAGPFDLLVTDQRMPLVTGVQLIEQARGLYPNLPCIILTAYTDPPDLIEAINKGHVYRYVTKPWDIQDFVLTVEGALAAEALRRENARLAQDNAHRLAALEVLNEVSQRAGSLSTYRDVVDQITGLLERVVSLDAAAVLVHAEAGRPASVTLRTRCAVAEEALQGLRDEVIDRYQGIDPAFVGDDLLFRLTGSQSGEAIPTLRSFLFLPLHSGGRTTGLMAVAAQAEDAFREEDQRVLDILANQAADAVVGLRQRLDAERQQLARMVEGMADGLIMTDSAGEVVVANAAALQLLGLPQDQQITSKLLQETLGFYPFELVRGWERRGERSVVEDLMVGGRVLHSVVSPVNDPSGALAGVAVVLRDVTEQRRLQTRKEEFVSIVSHELRTPLTSIIGALDLVLNHQVGPVSDKQTRYLGLAKSAADRMNEIVDDLLDISSLSKGRFRLDLEVALLDELVVDAVNVYEAAFQRRQVTVSIRRPEGGVRVLADGGRLTQVLNNLLTNASKFTPEGGEVQIEIFDNHEVSDSVGFSVWNNGEPIADEDLERVFERFERGRGEQRKVQGTGLGLPICRSIVEAHGGRIWVESGVGVGARFVVTLPVEAATTVSDPNEGIDSLDGEGAAKGARVLVVDDDRATAFALKGLLLSGGLVADVALDADEAMHLARTKRPAAVVVDLRMPGFDGYHLIDVIRHDPDTRGTPILAISGADEGEKVMRSGASAFLSKPLEPSRFVQSVRALVNRQAEGRRVMVLDDDDGIRALCVEALRGMGYSVEECASAAAFREQLLAFRPELVVMDVSLPDGDGFTLVEEMKADRALRMTSVIFISAMGETRDKVRALRLGGDDYIVKPFDAMELGVRVETVLRRKEQEIAASPTTRLPGGVAIEREINRRIHSGQPFALCYLDLDNLKAYNDYYGYAKADAVIFQTGDVLRGALTDFGTADDFLGHIAGDDFVMVTTPDRVEAVCRQATAAFDRVVPLYYGKEDRERGYIETEDRYGTLRRFPIMSLSAVAVCDPGGRFQSHADIAYAAAGLKKQAKSVPGSVFLLEDESQRASA